MRKLFVVSGTFLSLLTANPAHAVDTTASSDAAAMGTALSGTGFHLTGSTLNTDTQNGFFTNGSVIGIDHGVVLTTGSLGCVGNANTTGSCTGEGASSSLALTFTLDSDTLFFNYVFGSEEYPEYVGSQYNDFFQLLLNGPGFTNVNLAQFPNGGGDVNINNLLNGTNSLYWNANVLQPFELDGYTDVLTASASGLTPGATYTLSFNIADVGDANYDSAVFIQGGTIGVDQTPVGDVPEPATWAMMLLGFGVIGSAMRRQRNLSTAHPA